MRLLGLLIVAYALSPIDLIPDFIPVVGYLDELILLPLGLWIMLKLVPSPILHDCREKADRWLASGQQKPSSKLGATIVVLIWIMVAWWLISLFATSLA